MTRLDGQHNQIGYALVTRGAGEDERATLNAPVLPALVQVRRSPVQAVCAMPFVVSWSRPSADRNTVKSAASKVKPESRRICAERLELLRSRRV